MKILLVTFIIILFLLLFWGMKEFLHKNRISFSKFLCLILSLLFLNLSMFAFIMALFGILTIYSAVFFVGCEDVVLFCITFKNREKAREKNILFDKKKDLFFIVIMIFSFLIMVNQTQYLWGGRDPGLYLLKAVNIGREGTVKLDNNIEWNTKAEEYIKFADPEYRGIYAELEGAKVSHLYTQFLDYASSFLAVGYLVNGLHGIWIFNALLGVISIMVVYLFCSYVFSDTIALIASILLILNPAMIWNARITQSEIVFLTVWLLGCFFFSLAWEKKNEVLYAVFGIMAGCLGFIRIDACLVWIGILAVICYLCIYGMIEKKYILAMIFPFFITGGLSILYAICFSRQYWVEHWEKGILSSAIYFTLFLLFIVIFFLFYKRARIKKSVDILSVICEKSNLKIVLLISFFILHIIYMVRPLLQNGENADWDFSQRALREFGWYISIFIVPFCFIGIYTILKDEIIREKVFIFGITGLVNLIIYLYQPGIAPDHFWVSRRWIAVCIPYVIILGSIGIEVCVHKINVHKQIILIMRLIIVGGFCAFYLYNSRLFLGVPMLGEMEKQYENMVAVMDDDQVYFGQMSHYSSILRFVYGKTVFTLKEDCIDEIVEYTEKNNCCIYLIGDESLLSEQLNYEVIYTGEIKGTWIKQTVGSYPSELEMTGGITNIYKVWSKKI